MRKLLLSMAVLALGAVSASAAETSYTIEFKTRADNNGADFKTETQIADIVSEGADYISQIISTDKCANGMYGLKVGQNKNNGSIELGLSDLGKVTPSKVVLEVSANKNPAGLDFKFNGVRYMLESSNTNDTYATVTVTDFDSELESLTFARDNATSNTTQGFVYVKSVTVFYESAGPVLADPEISFEKVEYQATLGAEFESPVASTVSDGAVTYSSTDETVATVDPETGVVTLVGAGSTTIVASVAETATYRAGSASYELTVIDPNVANPVWTWSKGGEEVFDFILVGDNTVNPWSYDDRFGIKGSAYVSGAAKATECIAATPVLDLTNYDELTLNFRQAANMYKDNDNNGDLIAVDEFPDYAIIVARVAGQTEWTEVAKATAPAEFGWGFYDNEEIDLKAYDNTKMQFGFKYISDSSVAGTWDIDNIVLKGKLSSGVENITIDENAAPVYYNLQGVRVANPENGLYIEVRGNKSRKVMIR